MVTNNYHASFNLAQIPKNVGSARYGDYFIFIDNLSTESDNVLDIQPNFPVKNEAMVVLTVLEGSVRLRINLQEVEVKAGQTLGIMQGCIFQVLEVPDNWRYYCMMIAPEVIDMIQKSFGIHVNLSRRYYNFGLHSMSESAMETGLTMYHLIKEELNQPDYEYKKDVIQRYCEIWILKNLSRVQDEEVPEIRKPVGRKEQIFNDFLALLEQYYTQERSISFYADRMCLTPKYLSTIVKEVSGKHGMQWIDEYVALEAKALLREGTMSVKQVSDKLNFPSQSMFGRFFKKMTSYSPKQYMLL